MATTQSAHPDALAFERLAALRAAPPHAGPLADDLAEAGQIESLHERTQRFLPLLDAATQQKSHVPLLASIWASARAEQVAGLRLLASLVEVRHSGIELIHDMIRPSQSARMCALAARPGVAARVNDNVVQSLRMLGLRIGVTAETLAARPQDVVRAFHARALGLLQSLLKEGLREVEVAWLRDLADTEIRARASRLEVLAERVGAYDGRRIARILPYLSRQEERIRDTRAIVMQWPDTDELRRRTLALSQVFEPRHLQALLDDLGKEAETRELAHVLKLVQHNTPVSADVTFLAAVLRYVDAQTRPAGGRILDAARCVLLALQFGGPSARCELALATRDVRDIRWLYEALRLEMTGTIVHVRYDASRHVKFMAPDGIPELLTGEKAQVDDIRSLVLANIRNEHLLCGLLMSPRVASCPGLVEAVVQRTRSIKVLLEIANRRLLHTGYANRNVPSALLQSRTPVPVSALRKFVHVRFVDRADLLAMVARNSMVRPEVRQLITGYLESLATR